MMTLALFALLATDAPTMNGAEVLAGPDRERVHIAQKRVLAAQMEVLSMRLQANIDGVKLLGAEVASTEAGKFYQSLLAELQKKHKRDSCSLDIDLRWQCPPKN